MKDSASATFDDAATQREKRCRACGKDLRGHRRIRDGKTYICPVCDQLEREGQMPEGLPCAECDRKIHPASLRKWGDIQLCPKCWEEHQQDPKRKVRRVDKRMFKIEETRSIIALAAVAGLLLLLILIGWLF